MKLPLKIITAGILIISSFLLSTSCKNEHLEKDKATYTLLQGDWITDYKPNGMDLFHGHSTVFSFEDSLCSTENPFFEFNRFKIRENIVHIWSYGVHRKIIYHQYKILALNKKWLRIVSADSLKKGSKHDTLVLRKLQQENTILPDKISFFSSPCFGTCPSFCMEVDRSKNVRFYGRHHVDAMEGRKGKLSEKQYNMLVRLIRQLPIRTMKNHYDCHWTDDQTCCISIRHNGKWDEYYVYGYDKEPIELRILLNRFFFLSKTVKLTYDPAMDDSGFRAKQTCFKIEASQIIEPLPTTVFDK
jgi:hypothetical protein